MTSNPYQILGLGHDADASAIRARYLELVRQFPPEREPQRFAEIRAAYEQLRDPLVALENRLFSTTAGVSFDGLLAGERRDVRSRRIPTELLLSLGRK